MHIRSVAICGAVGIVALAVIAGAWLRSKQQSESVAAAITAGDASRAPDLIRRFGCGGCHTIPGVPGGDGQVGGPLQNLRTRVYIGGVATNTAENLIRFIVNPQSFSPQIAMPASGITEPDARDVATYLYAH